LVSLLTIEDIRKTYIEDKFLDYFFYLSLALFLIKAILVKDFYAIVFNHVIPFVIFLNFLYFLFLLGFIGDGDIYVISSVVLFFGAKKFLVSLIVASLFHSIITLSIIMFKRFKFLGLIFSILLLIFSTILTVKVGIVFAFIIVLITLVLLYLYKKGELLYEEVSGEEVLPLDIVKIGKKDFLVLDSNYLNYSKSINPLAKTLILYSRKYSLPQSIESEEFIHISSINKKEKYVRKIPLPFLPLILFSCLICIFPESSIINLLISSIFPQIF